MAKFRKKSVVIEAEQWQGSKESWDKIMAMGLTEWKPGEMGTDTFFIKTKEGLMKASVGDYIIKEPFDKERMFYPCKPDIFEMTYKMEKETKYPESGLTDDEIDLEKVVEEIKFSETTLEGIAILKKYLDKPLDANQLNIDSESKATKSFPMRGTNFPKESGLNFDEIEKNC